MKKLRYGFLAFLMAFQLVGCSSGSSETASGTYTPGTYQASARGMGGDVVVSLTVDSDHITDVSVDVSSESQGYGRDHQDDFESQILEADGAEIDGVSGCTVTSSAVKTAYETALAQARGESTTDHESSEADVIVVGAGAAGLAAAAYAHNNGASVIVLETNSSAGGAAATSGGNLLNINPPANKEDDRNDEALEKYSSYTVEDFPEEWQENFKELQEEIEEYRNNGEEKGSFDSVNRVIIDHFLNGDGTDLDGTRVSIDYDLVAPAFNESGDILKWLEENGLKIPDKSTASGHFSTPEGKGQGLIQVLLNACDGVEIVYNTRASGLVVENGKVTGVDAEKTDGTKVRYTAGKGVILATGGYASNTKMAAETQRMFTGLNENNPSNEPASIQGDGILMAQEIGAGTKDMTFLTTMLKGYQNLATSGEESTIYNASQLVVNENAVRFIDDKPTAGPSAAVRFAVNDEPDGVMFAIGDQKMIDALNENTEGLADDLIERGIAWSADTIEEAAEKAGLDPDTLENTIDTFNDYVDTGTDADYGRTEFNGKVEDGPVYLVKLQSAYHLTFGGLTVDADTHVLDTEGNIIEGLYAAGDVIGNFEGDVHQSGYCMTTVIYTGKTAGINAAE